MARYPTIEEYQKSGKYNDGLKRTLDFLKKNPKDPQLLILKLQFLLATDQDLTPTINDLLALQPPIVDLNDLVDIENAIAGSQRDDFPPPRTTGPSMARLWDNAVKASSKSPNVKLDILSLRFARGIALHRLADAQQALIQLKTHLPGNRTVYMAHAAVTALLSKEKGDMESRFALMLAKKAVKEKFDEEEGLDCRVVGQIFARFGEGGEVRGLEGGRFGESKQVHEVLRRGRREELVKNGEVVTFKGNAKGSTAGDQDSTVKEYEEMKDKFATLISTNSKTSELVDFAAHAIRLFATAIEKTGKHDRRRTAADICFLAISALIHLFSKSQQSTSPSPTPSTYLLISAYLAQTLLHHNENIHEARMILVYIYMRLNLGSLAIKMFDTLRVKEIQYDTVGHALFTRLSLIHPSVVGKSNVQASSDISLLDPNKMLRTALAVYTRCETKLSETEAEVLSHGQTGMIFDLEELRQSLRSSLTKRILLLEQRRLDRLTTGGTGEPPSLMGPQVTANWIGDHISDNRDFKSTFTLPSIPLDVEKILSPSSQSEDLLGREWIKRTLLVDSAWCLASNLPAPVKDVPALVAECDRSVREDFEALQLSDSGGDAEKEFLPVVNPAEVMAADLAWVVVQLVVIAGKKKDGGEAPEEGMVRHMVGVIRKGIEHLSKKIVGSGEEGASAGDGDVASASYATGLDEVFTYLDILRIVEKMAAFAIKEGHPDVKKIFTELKTLAAMKRAQLQTRAKVLRDSVEWKKVKHAMSSDKDLAVVVQAVWGLDQQHGSLDGFCQGAAESAREGWEGVGKIRAPV